MLRNRRQRGAPDDAEETVIIGAHPRSTALARRPLFRLGRVIYGAVLVFTAVDGLRNAQERAEYAAAKGVPRPRLSNYLSHALLLAGGIGITLWRAPAAAASATAAFLLAVTPQIHDFWNVDDPEQRQQQQIQFLKNTALLGTALVLLGVARADEGQ